MIDVSSKKFTENLLIAAEKYYQIQQRILEKKLSHKHPFSETGIWHKMFTDFAVKIWADPKKIVDYNLEFTQLQLQLVNNVLLRSVSAEERPLYQPIERDRRFKHESWHANMVFDYLLQSYLMTTNWLLKITDEVIEDRTQAKKINFFLRQITDALSPSNFVVTNPEVLKAIVDTNGENLVKGLDNLARDIENSKTTFKINNTDSNFFKVGENLACTPGKVVFQNKLMQLINYQNKTAVYKVPLLIIPPWINKYYILDLTPQNSLVKWLIDQGYNVYIISWVNPDKELKNIDFEDYIDQGSLAAIKFITASGHFPQVDIIGYCLGGTLSACTMAYLSKHKMNLVRSGTFLATLINFANSSELNLLIDDDMMKFINEQMAEDGYLDGDTMSTTFNMLRANDMIWQFFTHNYLLGKEPLPFDLLYWNADTTRLPAMMHQYYLQNMYQKNLLKESNGITLLKTKIDMKIIDVPCYFISTQEDHIVNWTSTYSTLNLFSGPVRFVLGGSGHVAGVINHPLLDKYYYYHGEKLYPTASEWLKSAKRETGSWWLDWHEWCKKLSGKKQSPLSYKELGYTVIEDAPGSYVLQK